MKKIIFLILFIILICFLIPAFFTKGFKTENASIEEISDSSSVVDYNYRDYDTISLLHKKTGEIEKINLDEYLYGVVAAEMPVDYEKEALKAQAIVARTYTIYKLIFDSNKHGDANICDDSACCQAWISKEDRFERWDEAQRDNNWKKIVDSVNSTARKDYYL